MASGRNHDQATVTWSLPVGLTASLWLGWCAGALTGLAFLLGGLWLSPDLDVRSRALQRWGALRWIWWPYQRLVPHRSLLSHGPLIGTTLRLTWVLGLLLLTWFALALLLGQAVTDPGEAWPDVLKLLKQHRTALIGVLIGLEGSVWLHLILDGDPMPIECSKRWRRRRRR